MPRGISQIAVQVATKLCDATGNLSQRGIILLTLPELQAIKRDEQGFNAVIIAHLRQHRPNLAVGELSLRMNTSEVEFTPECRDTCRIFLPQRLRGGISRLLPFLLVW